jgi:hypothetical protein
LFIPVLVAALLAGGAAFAASGEANVTEPVLQPNMPAQEDAISNTPGGAEVIVTNGRLTVSAQDAAIGNILSAISEQAGFEIAISPDVAPKTLSTQFTNMDIQKGIERLLALINHNDYFIYYGKDGGISRIEVHGAEENPDSSTQNTRGRDSRNIPPANNRRLRPPVRRTPRPVPSTPNRINRPPLSSPPMPVNPRSGDNGPARVIPPRRPAPARTGTTPYIPPTRMPAYIPPKDQN